MVGALEALKVHYFSLRLTLRWNCEIKHSATDKPYVNILINGSWAWLNINWIFEFNEFWADLGVCIIKLHFDGYSCEELSLEFNCSILEQQLH
jgi:hypothetical protein